jgi:hypothetical protein
VKWFGNGAEIKVKLVVVFTLCLSEIVWKRQFCRNSVSSVFKRSEIKTQRLAASCEQRFRRYFVPL